MQHEMRLAKEPFEKIVNGSKTVESRLYDEKRKKISLNDEIEFRQNDDASRTATKKVAAIYLYPSFRDMMRDLPPTLFGWTDAADAIAEIDRFYTQEDQKKYGVIGIKLA